MATLTAKRVETTTQIAVAMTTGNEITIEIMIRGDCVAVKREEVIVTAEAIVVSLDRDRVAHRQEATVKKKEAIVAIIVGLDRDHTAHRQETTVAIDE